MIKAAFLIGIACCSIDVAAQGGGDGIFYSSLNYAIQQGQMEGVATVAELKAHGDFGVGSQHRLAGELILLNGKAYKITVDGKATVMPDTARLPFAAAKFFKPEREYSIRQKLTLQELRAYIDSLDATSQFSAIEVTGHFTSIRYKVYYPQQKPYPTIKQTPAKFFDSSNISGTMVGFFTPKSALVLNSPNYHFHFINSSRTSGGHVEECMVENVTIKIDYADELKIKLPAASQLKNVNLNQPVKEE